MLPYYLLYSCHRSSREHNSHVANLNFKPIMLTLRKPLMTLHTINYRRYSSIIRLVILLKKIFASSKLSTPWTVRPKNIPIDLNCLSHSQLKCKYVNIRSTVRIRTFSNFINSLNEKKKQIFKLEGLCVCLFCENWGKIQSIISMKSQF